MQQEMQPQYPLLYSTPGYLYCELLLADVSLRIGNLLVRWPSKAVDPARTASEGHPTVVAELQSEIESLRNRAEIEDNDPLLDTALNHLTLGRTWQLESARSSGLSPSSPVASSETEPTAPAAGVAGGSAESKQPEASAFGSLKQAEHHLTQSVTLLRQAGTQHELPRGLLHRAALWREMGEGEKERGGDGERG